MIDFLFGWLTKGQMNISLLDTIVALLEMGVVFLIVIFVIFIIDKIKNRRKK